MEPIRHICVPIYQQTRGSLSAKVHAVFRRDVWSLLSIFGGLGQTTGGLSFAPDFHGILNRHPFPDVVHGCLLEGMALALERRFEPFSYGRGHITPERVEEIEIVAARHGIYLAPLYNADGPLEEQT